MMIQPDPRPDEGGGSNKPLLTAPSHPALDDPPRSELQPCEADCRSYLYRPGPQPCNLIAGTIEEQIARARAPKRPFDAEARSLEAILQAQPERLGPAILNATGEGIGEIVALLLRDR